MDGTPRQGRKATPAQTLAEIKFSAEALDDLDRLFDFLADSDPRAAIAHLHAIRTAIEVLALHPEIGRPMTGPFRELVISTGRTGYLAMYRYLPEGQEVRVLAIRHQREFDYRY